MVAKQSTFERHAQTVLVGIITLIIGWVGLSISNMQSKQNELITEQKITAVKIENLVNALQLQNATYVKQIDYVKWRQKVESRFETLEATRP